EVARFPRRLARSTMPVLAAPARLRCGPLPAPPRTPFLFLPAQGDRSALTRFLERLPVFKIKSHSVQESAMLRTNWLSWLTNRSRSQKIPRPRRPAYRRVPLGALRDWLLEDRCLPSTSTIFVGNNSFQLTTIDDPTQVLFLGGTAKGVDWGTVP